jgi:hypothetical protein
MSDDWVMKVRSHFFPNSRVEKTPIRQMTVIKIPILKQRLDSIEKEWLVRELYRYGNVSPNIWWKTERFRQCVVVLPRANVKKVRVFFRVCK